MSAPTVIRIVSDCSLVLITTVPIVAERMPFSSVNGLNEIVVLWSPNSIEAGGGFCAAGEAKGSCAEIGGAVVMTGVEVKVLIKLPGIIYVGHELADQTWVDKFSEKRHECM